MAQLVVLSCRKGGQGEAHDDATARACRLSSRPLASFAFFLAFVPDKQPALTDECMLTSPA